MNLQKNASLILPMDQEAELTIVVSLWIESFTHFCLLKLLQWYCIDGQLIQCETNMSNYLNILWMVFYVYLQPLYFPLISLYHIMQVLSPLCSVHRRHL